MRAKHRAKVQTRIELLKKLTLDDPNLVHRLRAKHGMDKSQAANAIVALKMFFDKDLPSLFNEVSHGPPTDVT